MQHIEQTGSRIAAEADSYSRITRRKPAKSTKSASTLDVDALFGTKSASTLEVDALLGAKSASTLEVDALFGSKTGFI